MMDAEKFLEAFSKASSVDIADEKKRRQALPEKLERVFNASNMGEISDISDDELISMLTEGIPDYFGLVSKIMSERLAVMGKFITVRGVQRKRIL